MAKARKKAGSWKGEEVEPEAPGRAERLAERAEGTERVTVAEEAERQRRREPAPKPATPAPPDRGRGAAEPTDDEENLREKRAAAAEAHQEREATDDPPRTKRL